MTSVVVLERLTIVAPLGVRFRDEATGAYVTDSLNVTVHPEWQPEVRTTGVPNTSSVFGFHDLPWMRDVDFDATPFEFVLEVVDRSGRFLPYRLPLLLPHEGILEQPLFSSPSRAPVDGMGVLRAELIDAGTQKPASWALIEAKAGEQRLVTGMADREGRVMLPLFYPKPVITLGSPGTPNTPLAQQTWAVDFTVRYRRREPVPEIPDLVDDLAQPAATAWEQTSPPAVWTQATLHFGRELRLATAAGGAGTSTLLITPAGSPP